MPVSNLLPQEQKRHSNPQNGPEILKRGGETKALVPDLLHLIESKSLSRLSSVNDSRRRYAAKLLPSQLMGFNVLRHIHSENHKDIFSVIARWVAYQARFVASQDEAVSSPKTSHLVQ